MDPSTTSPGRALTIDRPRKARIIRDAVLEQIVAPSGVRRLAVAGAVPAAVGFAWRGWPVACLMLVLGVLGQVGWWWRRLRAGVRNGLDVGQTIEVAYTNSGEMVITDSTGQVGLRRGSVIMVPRFRANVTVVGRELAFILPGELLDDADVAFLEGHGDAATGATVQGPELPLSCEITAGVQRAMVDSATRVVTRSADFLVLWLVTLFIVGVIAVVGPAPVVVGTGVFCALCFLVPGLLGIRRTRRRVRSRYPVGLIVRAGVTPERLLLSLTHGTSTIPWSRFSGLRVTSDAVLLRRVRKPLAADATAVLPVGLFDDDALATVSSAVSKRD